MTRLPEWLHLELDKLGVRFPPHEPVARPKPKPTTPTSQPIAQPGEF